MVRDFLLLGPRGEAINGYSIGYLGPGVLRVRDRKPSADRRSGLVRDEVTTISVVVENAGRTSRQEINVGVSTLERNALDGRLEIHVVRDDADIKLTALERPPTARKRWRTVHPAKCLRRGDACIPAGAGTCCGCRRTPASRPERACREHQPRRLPRRSERASRTQGSANGCSHERRKSAPLVHERTAAVFDCIRSARGSVLTEGGRVIRRSVHPRLTLLSRSWAIGQGRGARSA